jgi:LysR family transcriptional regulator, glycine cleavage system transcriptional activator
MSVSPPRPKSPPLNAMRAFEAAARLEGFVAAAEELSVTPGAVSQHIKTMETWAGAPLFQRNAQGVALTSAGLALLPGFVRAFDALGDAARAVRDIRPVSEVHIATLPSIAQLWLPRRLSRMRTEDPTLKFSVTALESRPNLSRELFDLSLFFADPTQAPNKVLLEHDRIFPVCAPALADKIRTPDGLNEVPLLQDQTWQDDWAIWAKSCGVHLANPLSGPRYSLYSLALEEAKSGAGVLMGHKSLVEDQVMAGELVQLFDMDCVTGKSLILETPIRQQDRGSFSRIVKLISDRRGSGCSP